VSVLLGNGDGTFQAAVAFGLCAPSFAAVADLDADSVTGNRFTDRVTVFLPEPKGWLMLICPVHPLKSTQPRNRSLCRESSPPQG
jgi:hypothetical protein